MTTAKAAKLLTTIEGLDPSEKIRADLAAEGRPVLVAFSGGKDSICAALALRDAGVQVHLVCLQLIPGMPLVEEGMESLADQIGLPVHRYQHPSLFRMLANGIYQPPERAQTIGAAELPKISFPLLWQMIREDLQLPEDTYLADGVRANDSPQRRIAFKKFGALKPESRKVSPIWDWSIAMIRRTLAEHQIQLPPDYELFGRTFDGLDIKFMGPLKEHRPEDYAVVKSWFPLIDLEMIRHGF
ncbi:hypothetical protein AB0O80_10530 [Rothia kristinae]|uniref:hypothetical protein n=1 Tax=Actinomycetes TaxID=1760 RepID=UPI003428009F